MNPPLLVYGNCQGNWLANALAADQEIKLRHDVYYLANFGTPDPTHPALAADFWKKNPVIIRQVADNPLRLFEAWVTPACRQIRFPMLWGKFLWPFHVLDPRNQIEAGLPFGRFYYGDRLVMQWLQAGLAPAGIPDHYLNEDLAKHINLERYWEICLAEMRHLDRQSDVSVAPFIEKEFRDRKLFATLLHPTHLLLGHVQRQIRAWILNTSVSANPEFPEDGAEILGEEEIPIHPQIIQALKLNWVTPETKYRYRSRLLSCREYLEAYVRFDLIPVGTSAQLQLDRAEQAYRMNQGDEARRLLYLGLAQFPAEPALYQPLAALLIEKKEFLQANYVLSQGLSLPDQSAGFHAEIFNQLGISNYGLGNFLQAERSFQTALELQPGWVEATNNLREVKKITRPPEPAARNGSFISSQ